MAAMSDSSSEDRIVHKTRGFDRQASSGPHLAPRTRGLALGLRVVSARAQAKSRATTRPRALRQSDCPVDERALERIGPRRRPDLPVSADLARTEVERRRCRPVESGRPARRCADSSSSKWAGRSALPVPPRPM